MAPYIGTYIKSEWHCQSDWVALCIGKSGSERAEYSPESAYELEDEKFAMVYMDAGLYAPTYSGLQYFFPRMSRDGVIILAGYENGRSLSVRKAVRDLEERYGAFLITPIGDVDGTAVIIHP